MSKILSADVEGEGKPGARVAASPSITGRIYQIVPTIGLDGKNLLNLLPVSKPSGNFVPLHQSPVISDVMQRNVSVSGHNNLQNLFANTTPFAKELECKKAAHDKLILPKLLGQVGKVDDSVIKENPTTLMTPGVIKKNLATPTVSSIQSNYYSTDRSLLQNDAALIYSEKNNAGSVFVNGNGLPVAAKSQILLSGHPLQIPAHAEVKSVPDSLLSPPVQQKILATVISNASGVPQTTKAPPIIYVSPINTVKSAAIKGLQNTCPKSITNISESLMLTVPQTAVNSSLCGAASGNEKKQTSVLKWVVQESPQSSASCLIPVKSSNNMASNILNTFGNVKDLADNPTSSNNLSESQAEATCINDDAVVTYNGKMYLLTKKESSAVSEKKYSKQILPTEEIHFRKHKSHLISSEDNIITNKVVNLVLSKSKGVACTPSDPKAFQNMKPQLPSDLDKSLKVASTVLVASHGNVQISSTSQHGAMSELGNIPLEMIVDQKQVTRGNTTQNFIQKILFHKPAASTLLPSTMLDASKEEEKIEIIPKIQIEHRKEQDRKHYLELRKRNGLFKEERVYLKRIPIPVTPTRPETTVCSIGVQMTDSCDFSQRVPIKSELQEEEKLIEEPEEELNIKRKTQTVPVAKHTKRKKTMVNPDVEQNDSFSLMNNPNSPCRQLESHQNNSQGFPQFSQRMDLDSNHCTQSNEEISIFSPASDCCESETSPSHNEGSFKEEIFPFSSPDLEDTIRDEKITRLKLLLKEQEAALEEIRKKMQQT